jgi:hypothetical protein
VEERNTQRPKMAMMVIDKMKFQVVEDFDDRINTFFSYRHLQYASSFLSVCSPLSMSRGASVDIKQPDRQTTDVWQW